jgi:hypothetical protein
LRKSETEKFREKTQLLVDQYSALKNERAKAAVDVAEREYKNRLASERGRLAAVQAQQQAKARDDKSKLDLRKFEDSTKRADAKEKRDEERFERTQGHREEVDGKRLENDKIRIGIQRLVAEAKGGKLDYSKIAAAANMDSDFIKLFPDVLDRRDNPTGRKVGLPTDTKVLAEMYAKYLADLEAEKAKPASNGGSKGDPRGGMY